MNKFNERRRNSNINVNNNINNTNSNNENKRYENMISLEQMDSEDTGMVLYFTISNNRDLLRNSPNTNGPIVLYRNSVKKHSAGNSPDKNYPKSFYIEYRPEHGGTMHIFSCK